MEGPGSSCSPRSDQISLAAEHEKALAVLTSLSLENTMKLISVLVNLYGEGE